MSKRPKSKLIPSPYLQLKYLLYNEPLASFRLSLWEFKKILPNTFIYESILIKIYMNANIMNANIMNANIMNANIMNVQIFHLIKVDLRGNWRSQNVTL